MKLNDLYESRQNGKKEEVIKTKRGARITLGHLLKLRKIRERKKLEKLKDIELYKQMYSPDDDGGGF